MKTLLPFVALVIDASTIVYADMPGADRMTKDQVTKKLEGLATRISASSRPTTAIGKATRRRVEIHVDPHSGELTKNEPQDND